MSPSFLSSARRQSFDARRQRPPAGAGGITLPGGLAVAKSLLWE
jgi:hypothetical protein